MENSAKCNNRVFERRGAMRGSSTRKKNSEEKKLSIKEPPTETPPPTKSKLSSQNRSDSKFSRCPAAAPAAVMTSQTCPATGPVTSHTYTTGGGGGRGSAQFEESSLHSVDLSMEPEPLNYGESKISRKRSRRIVGGRFRRLSRPAAAAAAAVATNNENALQQQSTAHAPMKTNCVHATTAVSNSSPIPAGLRAPPGNCPAATAAAFNGRKASCNSVGAGHLEDCRPPGGHNNCGRLGPPPLTGTSCPYNGSCNPEAAAVWCSPGSSAELREFDEGLRRQRPNVDKAKILKSAYHQSLLRVSWNLIESEILHSPDSFDMGYDIQQYFALHQSLTLEDLARANSRHTLNGLMRVVSKVLKYLENLEEVEDYLKFVGRIHDCASVDPHFLDVTGLAFCQALDNLGHHTDIWNQEVKDTWQTFFRVIVRIMKKGYAQNNLLIHSAAHHPHSSCCHSSLSNSNNNKPLVIPTEHKTFITEVWVTFQDNIIHYLKNSLLLPLVIRSNRTISKYFVGYDTTISCLRFDGSAGIATLGKTKHASWFLTSVLSKIIPHLDNMEACEDYLEGLGRRHCELGVRIEHLDLLALVYCSAVRAVVAGQGVRGGPLFDTTRAWFHFLRAMVSVMKRGYNCPPQILTDEGSSDIDQDLADEFNKLGKQDRSAAGAAGRANSASIGGARNSTSGGVCPMSAAAANNGHNSDSETDAAAVAAADPNAAAAAANLKSPSGGSGNSSGNGSNNFFVMKRRNAFWSLDCRADSLPGGNTGLPPGAVVGGGGGGGRSSSAAAVARAAAYSAAFLNSGNSLASASIGGGLHHNNGSGGGGSPGNTRRGNKSRGDNAAGANSKKQRSRQFSLQF